VPDAQWTIERERVARAAAVAFRRHHVHLRERRQRPRQTGETGREIAVVVAQQDAHVGIQINRQDAKNARKR